MRTPAIVITARGNLGNQMLQFMLARSLQRLVPDLTIYGHSLENWNLFGETSPRISRFAPSTRMSDPDLPKISQLLKSELPIVKYGRVPLRVGSFLSKEAHEVDFPAKRLDVETAHRDEILINVRGAETLTNRHPDYGPIPINFYRKILDATGLKPVFLGQIGSDYYSNLLRKSFPQSRIIESQGTDGDFQTIRMARHIVPALSTFSWLAAWLSNAETIHLPLLGLYNPRQRPDSWLLPEDDKRYKFYWFKERRWIASTEQISGLEAPLELLPVTISDLEETKRDIEAKRAKLIEIDLSRLKKRGRLSRFALAINRFWY